MVAFAAPVYPIEKRRGSFVASVISLRVRGDEVNANFVLWAIPESPAFPAHLHGPEVLIIGGTFAGRVERGEEILRPLREFDEPILDMSSPIQYCALQQLYDPFFRKGQHLQYWKAILS